MPKTYDKLTAWLFKTNALRVCPKDKPFWYTSGFIGPYYINTHFLYGNEEKASELLEIIDNEKENIFTCPARILELVKENYQKDPIYKGIIDEMCGFIKSNINLSDVHFISGGERRDWFFSLIIADMLSKPHLSIFKDLKIVKSIGNKAEPIDDLDSKDVLHIADLITSASSYERAWVPAIKSLGGTIKWSIVVVDRKQGGAELLASEDIESYSMIDIDSKLFDKALEMGIINEHQHKMVMEYVKNPKDSMRRFLIENPEFIEDSLKSDDRTKSRAKLCIEKDLYNLK